MSKSWTQILRQPSWRIGLGLGALVASVSLSSCLMLSGGLNNTALARLQFPYLRVVNGKLMADKTGRFAGKEVQAKVLGAVISNAVGGMNYGKYSDGSTTDYHDMFWTRVAKKADPTAFMSSIVSDITGAGLNSVRIILHYCESGGGATGNVPVGCATTFDQTQYNRIIQHVSTFVGLCEAAGLMVEVNLFDQFNNFGTDDAQNQVWLNKLFETFASNRNVVWSLRNEPLAYIWRDIPPASVVSTMNTLVAWYDAMANYIRTKDLDSSGTRRHMVGLSEIQTDALDKLNLDYYDIAFLHTANRSAAVGGYLDGAIYKLAALGRKMSVILDEFLCSDLTGVCSGDAAVEEYFRVAVRSINNRLFKTFGNVNLDGGMVWTLYDSCEDTSPCDITRTDGTQQMSWGIYSCLPDQSCGTRKRSHVTSQLATISFKTNFLALSAPTYEGVMERTLASSADLWDASILTTTLLTDGGAGGASNWNWWGGNPVHILFALLSVDSANDTLRLTFQRPYCWGERQTGTLKLASATVMDNLNDKSDVFLTYDLRDGTGANNPITNGAITIDMVKGNASTGGIDAANLLWGNDTSADTIPDLDYKRLNIEAFVPGHYEYNLSQIMRDEGVSGNAIIGLRLNFSEKTATLYPLNNASCASTVGYGTGAGRGSLKNLKISRYSMLFR